MEHKLTKPELEQQIRRRELSDCEYTDAWLEQQGYDVRTFNSTAIKLLQAYTQAVQITQNHRQYLKSEQLKMLEEFIGKMKNSSHRKQLNPKTALPILNLTAKINRQLFKAHRQATRSQ
jgi:hypothetical protein